MWAPRPLDYITGDNYIEMKEHSASYHIEVEAGKLTNIERTVS